MSVSGNPNILLAIADDLGSDSVLVTDRSPETRMYVMTDADGPKVLGHLDHLSLLCRNGLYFTQAWAHPACSPTRGSIYTGTWPWRNGVGYPSGPRLDPGDVWTLPEQLNPTGDLAGYVSGLFGKWHLGSAPTFRPPQHGWDLHVGTLAGTVPDYKSWDKLTSADGYATTTPTTTYVTKDTVEEAGTWINDQAALPDDPPWFATIAFHSPHDPFHAPPWTGSYQLPGSTPITDDEMFNAMAQNLDHHLGRLLGSGVGDPIDAIPQDQLENTVIIFIGDNGSPSEVAEEEPKTEIGEGGVRVPMIVADGTSVAAAMTGSPAPPAFLSERKLDRRSEKLVHVVDLYATILEIAGAALPPDTIDSVSLWRFPSQAGNQPATRPYNFSQYYRTSAGPGEPLQGATIRNDDYKLNCEVDDAGNSTWSFYEYAIEGEIPGLEDPTSPYPAEDIYATAIADVIANTSNPAADNLAELLAELIDSLSYQLEDTGTPSWADHDPR